MTRVILAVSLVLASLAPAPAAADVFRWTDERGVTHYADDLDRVPERFRQRALRFSDEASQPGAPPDRPPADPRATPVTITFKPGDRIIVKVRINDRITAPMILDPEAPHTSISPSVLSAAGAIERRTRRPSAVERTIVESLAVGTARTGRMLVDAYEGPTSGVLGRDFLVRFDHTIDPQRGVVRLIPSGDGAR